MYTEFFGRANFLVDGRRNNIQLLMLASDFPQVYNVLCLLIKAKMAFVSIRQSATLKHVAETPDSKEKSLL